MSCAGSAFFMSAAKYSPAGPPPMQTILNRRASLDPGRAHAGDASRASVSPQVAPTGVCRRGGARPR